MTATFFEMHKVSVMPAQADITKNALYLHNFKPGKLHLYMSNVAGDAALEVAQTPRLDGPDEVYPNIETIYTITNYDFKEAYVDPVALGGTVKRIRNKIYYTPPANGNIGFTFDGVTYNLVLSGARAKKPSITVPAQNKEDIGSTLLALCTQLDPLVAGIEYSSSNWDISTTPDFSSGVTTLTVETTSYIQIPVGLMNSGTRYYLRMRHNYVGSYTGNTEYSDTIQINTREYFVPTNEVGYIYPPDYLVGSYFGSVIAISGNGRVMAIGAPNAPNGTNANSGLVFIYTKQYPSGAWILETRIAVATANLYLGCSLSLSYSGTTIAIGSKNAANKGSVYIYQKTGVTWAAQTVNTPSGMSNGCLFGSAVALSANGNILFVSAPLLNGGNTGSGQILSFTRSGTTWSAATTFSHTDKQANDNLGTTLVCNAAGTIVAAGARLRDAKNFTGADSGAVYVFTGSATTAFNQSNIFVPDTPVSSVYASQIATALSMNDAGTVIAFTATGSAGNNAITNYLYVYTGSGSSWTRSLYKTQNLSTYNAYTGASCSLDSTGTVLCVGSSYPTGRGYAEVYKNTGSNTWIKASEFNATNGSTGDLETYGASICISKDANEMFVGAPLEKLSATGYSAANVGCVYFYN